MVGVVVLALDIAKGFVPASFFPLWFGGFWGGAPPVSVAVVCGLGAILGHVFTVFMRFRGGKGVATGLGVILATMWPVGLALIVTWIIVAVISRVSSLGALAAAITAPFYAWYLSEHSQYVILTLIISILLIWRHRANIQQLFAGTEGKIGSSL